MLSEQDALDSKPSSMPMMTRQYKCTTRHPHQTVNNGAAHALKPKDFTPRPQSTTSSTNSEVVATAAS